MVVLLGFNCIVLVWFVVDSWIYYAKVLPVIGEDPVYFPFSRLRQIDRYVAKATENGLTLWFIPYLRHQKTMVLCLLAGMFFFCVWLNFQ